MAIDFTMEKLIIKNFGPINEATIEIKKFLVFTGNQATGKSTLAKLISIFKDFEFILDEKRDFKKILTEYNINNYLKKDSYIEYISPNYEARYTNTYLIVNQTQEFQKAIEEEKNKVMLFFSNIIEKNNDLRIGNDKEGFLQKLYDSNWKRFFSISAEQVYIPAERMLLSLIRESPFAVFSNFSLPKCITKFGTLFDSAKTRLNPFEIDFLNIKVVIDEGSPKIYFNDETFIELSESASGYQTTIPMLLVIANECMQNNRSIIIEEPELSLFPSTQRDLIHFVIRKMEENKKNNDGSLLLTTHSPYVLSILNTLIFAHIVSEKKPNTIEQINDFIPRNLWINPKDFNAYYFEKGTVRSMINEHSMIHESELDNISEDLKGEFDNLIEILKTV